MIIRCKLEQNRYTTRSSGESLSSGEKFTSLGNSNNHNKETRYMTTPDNTRTIDEAIAEVRASVARKKKAARKDTPQSNEKNDPSKEEEKEALSAEEKEARKAAKKAEREARNAERKARLEEERQAKNAERLARKAERDANRTEKVAHLSKVEKAAERLPELTPGAISYLNSLEPERANVTDLAVTLAHAQHILRARQTKASHDVDLKEGQVVRVISGEGRWIGAMATVKAVRSIRVIISVAGYDKDIYVFAADLVPCEAVEREVVMSEASDEDVAQAV